MTISRRRSGRSAISSVAHRFQSSVDGPHPPRTAPSLFQAGANSLLDVFS